jgi:hypothetical protein
LRSNGEQFFCAKDDCIIVVRRTHGLCNEVAALKKRGYTYSMLLAKYKEHATDE